MKAHFSRIRSFRADQNTGGALLEFPTRTAMHGKSRVSSAISPIINKISKLFLNSDGSSVGYVLERWSQGGASGVTLKMDKIYYQPNHLWKGQKAKGT